MKIIIVTPAGKKSRYGNRNTASRWAALLRDLGHKVIVEVTWSGLDANAMIALHARRSHDSIYRFAQKHPARPLIVVLTGTDLYRDIRFDADAQLSMQLASRMVVLQDMGLKELAPALRLKTQVIYQSAPAVPPQARLKSCFEVLVSGHLREEKDPFRAAAALAFLPRTSRIRVTHIGGAMSPEYTDQAQQWMQRESRYHWLGEVTHGRAIRLLARSCVMVISSRMEGGANVVCEALAASVPVIASRVSGNIGMLGRDYAGYYPLEDEQALAKRLEQAEVNDLFLRRLTAQCRARKFLVSEFRERNELRKLMMNIP
jgi:putative glycosyltransferase (TIGR04348 family)